MPLGGDDLKRALADIASGVNVPFDPGPARDPIFAPDLDPDDVPAVLAYLDAAGKELADG